MEGKLKCVYAYIYIYVLYTHIGSHQVIILMENKIESRWIINWKPGLPGISMVQDSGSANRLRRGWRNGKESGN